MKLFWINHQTKTHYPCRLPFCNSFLRVFRALEGSISVQHIQYPYLDISETRCKFCYYEWNLYFFRSTFKTIYSIWFMDEILKHYRFMWLLYILKRFLSKAQLVVIFRDRMHARFKCTPQQVVQEDSVSLHYSSSFELKVEPNVMTKPVLRCASENGSALISGNNHTWVPSCIYTF